MTAAQRRDRWLAKPVVLPAVLVGAGLLVVSGSGTWVEGTVADAVLGTSRISAPGSQVAQGAFAAAFVGGASALAAGTAGRVARIVAAVAMMAAGVLCLASILRLAADPGAALGRLAAELTGRTGSVPAEGTLTPWPWVAVLGSVLVALGGVAVLLAHRSWSGLSSRYEAPVADPASAIEGPTGATEGPTGAAEGSAVPSEGPGPEGSGPRGERTDSTWDRLSRGEDPT